MYLTDYAEIEKFARDHINSNFYSYLNDKEFSFLIILDTIEAKGYKVTYKVLRTVWSILERN